ncbi:hypothetical protein [Achromobacter sp. AGC39]
MSTNPTMTDADLDALLADLGAAPTAAAPAEVPAAVAAAPVAEAAPSVPAAGAAEEVPEDLLAELDLGGTSAPASPEPVAEAAPEPAAAVEPEPAPEPEAAPVAEAPPAAPVVEPEPEAVAPVAPAATKPSSGLLSVIEYVDADTLKRDVRITLSDLDDAMVKHAGLFVHYAEQAVKARAQHDRMKNHQSVLQAKLDAEHRERLADEGKKFTEAVVTAAVAADARMAKINQLVGDAHAIWKLAEVAANAFDQRKDMILELARDRRKEREGQLRVSESQALREKANAVAAAASSARAA